MKILYLIVGFIIALTGCATSSTSVDTEDVRIGVIDIQKILQYSKAARQARETLLEDLETKRTQMKAKQYDLRQIQEGLKRRGKDLSPSERESAEERLEKEIKELRRFKKDLEEEWKKKNAELTRKLMSDIREIVKKVREEANYAVIFEKKSLMAHDEEIDITQQIIQIYNARKK